MKSEADDEGRKVGEKVYSTASNAHDNSIYKFEQNYDSKNRLTKQSLTTELTSVPVTYTYTENETAGTSSIAAKYANARTITTNYDADGRPVARSFNSDTPTTDAISYNDDGMVSTYRVGSDTFTYTYNADGRITLVKKNSVLRQSYGYYADGQLRRENDLDSNKTVLYTYDSGGNITKKTEHPYSTSGTVSAATSTVNYTYDSTWKDKLTSYNGESISYDAMGNPTTYRGATATWFGRQLRSYTKGSTSVSYKYDENGLRTQKTVNGVVHDYYYVGDRLVYEKLGDEYEYFYCYDADGRLAMVERVIISSGAKGYFFTITNAQGDVVGIRSTTGAVIARYNYDAFGKLISTTDNSGNTLPSYSFAYQISVRYRGYYYDSETGLYYLQSRYYDPETGRFLNADDVNFLGATKTLLSYNAFAYCENDVVNNSDPSGKIAFTLINCMLIGVAVGVVVGLINGTYYGYRNGLRGWKLVGNSIKSGIYWAANGAVVGSATYALYGVVSSMYRGCVLAISKTGTASATVSVIKRLPSRSITMALSNKDRLNHAFKHIGKSVIGKNLNKRSMNEWKEWIEYGLKNCSAMFLNKLGGESVTGYYICRGGKNYAIYVYTSGKYSGLVATVVELSKKQMQKFGLW